MTKINLELGAEAFAVCMPLVVVVIGNPAGLGCIGYVEI